MKTLIAIGMLQALAIVASVVRLKVISIGLGPIGLGLVGTIDQLLQAVAQLSALSLPLNALKFMARAHSKGHREFNDSYAGFFRALLLLSVAGTVVAVTVISLRPDVLSADRRLSTGLLVVALLNVPTTSLGLLLTNVFAAAHRSVAAAALQFGLAATLAVAAVIGVTSGGIAAVYAISLGLSVALVLIVIAYLRRRMHLSLLEVRHSVLTELRQHPGVVRSSVAAYVSLSAVAVALLAPRYAVLGYQGAEQAGYFQAVLSTALALGAVLNAMTGQYLLPLLNRNLPLSEKFRAIDEFQIRQLLLFGLAALPVAMLPDIVLQILFSGRFQQASPWLAPLIGWQLLILQGGLMQQILFSLDDVVMLMMLTCAGYGAAAALGFAWVPGFGVNGVIAGLIIGALAMLGAFYLRLRSAHGLSISPRALAITAYIIVGLVIARALVGETGLQYPLAARVMTALVLMAGLWFFVPAQEKASLAAYLRPARRPAVNEQSV